MVGAPTPAPVTAEAELIPGYYNGCATAKAEARHDLIGTRIKCDDDIGTIKYVGEVVGYTGLWYGVEWDEVSRGRHSGCVDGLQYFSTSRPGAGSFVRPHRVAPTVSCADAIRRQYADREDEATAAHRKCAINEWKREMGASFIEMVGFDKIRDRQECLESLQHASVRDECVSRAGDVASLCPRLRSLAAPRNLLGGWREVVSLCSQLPQLTDLDISKNRLKMDLTDDDLKREFPSLRKLNVSHCELTWSDIMRLATLFPDLDELIAASGNVGKMAAPIGVFDGLTTLRLDGNETDWRYVNELGGMKSLKLLSLNECSLTDVRIEPGSFESLEVLLLNRNQIADWRSICELDKLKNLRRLYLLKNPLSADDYDTAAQMVVARVGGLQELNGSAITAEARRGAEYDYLKRCGAEWRRDPARHPRLARLVDKYGFPEASLLTQEPKHTSLTSKLIEIHLKSADGKILTKKFPSNMMVQKLTTLAQRIFSNGNTGPPELAVLDQERGNTEIKLDNAMKDLNYFSVRNGDTVIVRWS